MRRARLRKMYVGEKIKAEIVTEALVRKRWGPSTTAIPFDIILINDNLRITAS